MNGLILNTFFYQKLNKSTINFFTMLLYDIFGKQRQN